MPCDDAPLNQLQCRERNDGLYLPITYLSARLAGELAVVVLQSLVVSAMVFYPLALRGAFVVFWLAWLLTTSVGVGKIAGTLASIHLDSRPN